MHLYDMYDGENFNSLKTVKDNGNLEYLIGNYTFVIHTYNNELIDYVDILRTDNIFYGDYYEVGTTKSSKAVDDKGNRIKGSIYKKKYIYDLNYYSDTQVMDLDMDVIAYPIGLQVFLTDDGDSSDYDALARCLYSLATNPTARYWLPETHYMITNNYPYRYFD